jgi:CheY-like chemotaxis protein
VQKKILIVDDDQLVLYGLAKALRSEAVDVVTAATATAALHEIGQCLFDLCLVDIHLPDLCGIELMKQIKSACPEIKCIIMTASYRDKHEYSERMRQVAEITGCHFLPKPFDLTHMRNLVLLALKRDDLFCRPAEPQPITSSAWQKRNTTRQPYTEEILFTVQENGHGAPEGHAIMARARDISADGIGLLSDFMLYVGQLLQFTEKQGNRQGRVIWSRSDDYGKCTAGIQFAEA